LALRTTTASATSATSAGHGASPTASAAGISRRTGLAEAFQKTQGFNRALPIVAKEDREHERRQREIDPRKLLLRPGDAIGAQREIAPCKRVGGTNEFPISSTTIVVEDHPRG